MKIFLQSVELILAVLLITTILLQQRGTSLGGAFGSESSAYRSRRGVESFLFRSTIIIAILFVGVAITILLVIHG